MSSRVRRPTCRVDRPRGARRADDPAHRRPLPRPRGGDLDPRPAPHQPLGDRTAEGAPLRASGRRRRARPRRHDARARGAARDRSRPGLDRRRTTRHPLRRRRGRGRGPGLVDFVRAELASVIAATTPPAIARARGIRNRRRALRLRPHRAPARPHPHRAHRRRPRPAPARDRRAQGLRQRPREAREPAAPRLGARPVRRHDRGRRAGEHDPRERHAHPGDLRERPGDDRLHRLRHRRRDRRRQHRPLARRRGALAAPALDRRRPRAAHGARQGRDQEHRARHQRRRHRADRHASCRPPRARRTPSRPC